MPGLAADGYMFLQSLLMMRGCSCSSCLLDQHCTLTCSVLCCSAAVYVFSQLLSPFVLSWAHTPGQHPVQVWGQPAQVAKRDGTPNMCARVGVKSVSGSSWCCRPRGDVPLEDQTVWQVWVPAAAAAAAAAAAVDMLSCSRYPACAHKLIINPRHSSPTLQMPVFSCCPLKSGLADELRSVLVPPCGV